MASPLVVDMLGAPIGIDLSVLPEQVQDEARAAWADALAPAGAQPVVTVTPDSQLDGARSLEKLSQQVTLAGIHFHKGKMWMLHAAGIADDDGRVLVFVGPSGRGKTTASIALGREFGYVSDETVGIAADGSVYAYRKPLSIIDTPGSPKVQRSPSSLGLRPLPDRPLRLAKIVLLDRREDGPETPTVELVSLVDAIEEIAPQSSSLAAMDTPLQFIAARTTETRGMTRISYCEAASLPAAIGELLGDQHGATARVVAAIGVSNPQTRTGSESRFSRAAFTDAVLDGNSLVLLQRCSAEGEATVRILGGIAPALWRVADNATLGCLVDEAVSAYGEPQSGNVADLIAAATRDLVLAGVLVASEDVGGCRLRSKCHDKG